MLGFSMARVVSMEMMVPVTNKAGYVTIGNLVYVVNNPKWVATSELRNMIIRGAAMAMR